jgi:hypothetical protein
MQEFAPLLAGLAQPERVSKSFYSDPQGRQSAREQRQLYLPTRKNRRDCQSDWYSGNYQFYRAAMGDLFQSQMLRVRRMVIRQIREVDFCNPRQVIPGSIQFTLEGVALIYIRKGMSSLNIDVIQTLVARGRRGKRHRKVDSVQEFKEHS